MTGKTEGEIYTLSLTPTDETSKNLIKKFNKLIVNYNALYTDNKNDNKYTSQINSTYGKEIYTVIKKIKKDAADIHAESVTYLEESSEVLQSKENGKFKTKYDDFIEKNTIYDSDKNKSDASSKFKLDVYDRNIEDNIFIIYYLLSYGILGLFIYKLLKQ